MRLWVYPDTSAWIAAIVSRFEASAEVARREGRRLEVVLSGGTTPEPVYRALARLPLRGTELRFWIGDERAVASRDPARNGLLVERCFEGSDWNPAPELRLWPEGGTVTAVSRFAEEIIAALGTQPAFDIAFLGIGLDGHTAGLFPGDAASEEAFGLARQPGGLSTGLTLGTVAPSPPRERMTLSPTALMGARNLIFLARGQEKAGILPVILGPGGQSMPARRLADLAEAQGHHLDIYLSSEG